MGLAVTFFLGTFIIIGAVIARSTRDSELIENLSISIAFGSMFTLALWELLPEALENLGGGRWSTVFLCVAVGILLLKVLDHFIPEHDGAPGFEHDCTPENVIHIGIMSSIAVIAHNIIEGMAVYSISEESVRMGMLVALGVGLHNIPMGMFLYSTLQKENRGRKVVLLAGASLSTFLGGIMMKLLWFMISDFVVGILISLTLGMIVYIVAFELLPHLMHLKRRGASVVGVIIGVAVIVVSSLLE